MLEIDVAAGFIDVIGQSTRDSFISDQLLTNYYSIPTNRSTGSSILEQEVIYIRVVSRDFLGTLFFKMVIFPYRHHSCLGVRKLQIFNISDPLKTYSVESNL